MLGAITLKVLKANILGSTKWYPIEETKQRPSGP